MILKLLIPGHDTLGADRVETLQSRIRCIEDDAGDNGHRVQRYKYEWLCIVSISGKRFMRTYSEQELFSAIERGIYGIADF